MLVSKRLVYIYEIYLDLTNKKYNFVGTPNVGKRSRRQKHRDREDLSNMNLSSSFSSLTLNNIARDRKVFSGLSNSSSGTVGAIRALRRRPASAGRAELRMDGNKPIWR